MGAAQTSVRTAATRAAVLLGALGWLATSQAVEFPLLPAIKSDLAKDSLLLDAARDSERLLVGGEQGNILYSDDDGASWIQADVPISFAITSVAFGGDGHAWATAHDGYLLHSSDNGATWEVKLTGSDVAALSVGAIEAQVQSLEAVLEQATPETREEAEWALDDALFALEEAQAAIGDGMTSPLLETWFADDAFGYVLGAYGVFLHTTDGGATWVAHNNRLHNPDNYHLYGMARSSAGTLLVAGEAGTLQRSLDNGATWERVETPYQGSYFGAVAPSDGGLLIFGLRGNVFRSNDEGASWQAVDTGDQRTLMCGAAREDGSVMLAGAAGVVLESKDAGASFEVVPTNTSTVYSGVIFDAGGEALLVGFGGVSRIGETGDE
ncbi:MAG: photosystem I reaction center subunit IV [Gammaproteobacteria bacterium]|nr:photosystem I reaction center subunit IV [Gammaproteobacteria bacterium]MBT8104769.1 photosystem I reaction center subunit IV [Gammaproteobacteria bacterium]NNK24783.1 photosystem I reaction center subunit IV [Woeseiaceae bacterium]